ncbi:hypothetical protein J22TS1_05040 [Siminovitchia terrae]|nr:hypothetical protein J22TS1_05040 [Siminovitchia terrae]
MFRVDLNLSTALSGVAGMIPSFGTSTLIRVVSWQRNYARRGSMSSHLAALPDM